MKVIGILEKSSLSGTEEFQPIWIGWVKGG